MRRILAATVATVAGVALAGGLTPSAALAHDGGYTPPAITWGACPTARLINAGAECGMLTVPLDYRKPRGTKIQLAVSRIKAKNPNYQGVMLVNPGGPGASGLGLATLGSSIPDGVGGDYDWIGFDPRGVGRSVPALTCDPNITAYNRPYYVPVTRELEKTWLARTKAYAQACDRAGGELLDHVKTTDTVADMESIRKALGAKKINFYGFSYGSYLGQVYSTLHPDKTRRMVLDGVIDPTRVWYGANLDQDVQFDKNMDTYFAWIAKYDSVYHLGTSGRAVKAKYYAVLQKLRTAPIEGKVGPDEWNDFFVGAGYYVYGWEGTAEVFAAYVNDNDAGPLLESVGGPGNDNGYAMYLATQCSDVQWPTNWNKWRFDNWNLHAKYPFITWNNAWYNAPCIWWGTKPGKPVNVDGKKAPALLLIAETNDAATPFTGALETRKRYPRSVLIEGVGGTTHSGSLSGVACTDDKIAAYLSTGVLPARKPGNRSDVKCDPVPQPDPTASAAAAKLSAGAGVARAGLRPTITR